MRDATALVLGPAPAAAGINQHATADAVHLFHGGLDLPSCDLHLKLFVVCLFMLLPLA